MSKPQSFVRSAKVIAAWTLVSRVTGLARDTLLNAAFGQNWVQDAFVFGFQIPNLFRRLFGEGTLSSVFVPTFAETLERQDRPAAWSLLANVLARMSAALLFITVILEIVAVALWWRQSGAERALSTGLTAVMLPFMISICVVALFSSILNCLGHFAVPAAMPIVLNLCMIAGIEFARRYAPKPESAVYWVAASVLVTGILQVLILWPVMRAAGVRLGLEWRRDDPQLAAMRTAFMPVMLGQGALMLGPFLDNLICTFLTRAPGDPEQKQFLGFVFNYPLTGGALSAISNAQRLYQFPLGVLAISLATAALPAFSRLAAQGNMPGLRTALGRALRLAAFEGLPCGLVMIVLAEPIIALLFQHGKFTAANTTRAAEVLRWYGLGIWAFCVQHVVLRGFYSIKDTRTPMQVGVAMMFLNVAISLTLIWHPSIHESAFAIATTATTILNFSITLSLLRRKLGGRMGGRILAAALARTLLASLIATAAAASTYYGMLHAGLTLVPMLHRAALVFLPLALAMLVYFAAARLLRMDELHWLLGHEDTPHPFEVIPG